MLAANGMPVDKVVRGYRHTSWLYCNLYKFKNLPLNQQTEPFYLPAVIGRWSVGWVCALANAFMGSFCKFLKQKLGAFASARRVCRGFIFLLFISFVLRFPCHLTCNNIPE
jgi:hypothetical protein